MTGETGYLLAEKTNLRGDNLFFQGDKKKFPGR